MMAQVLVREVDDEVVEKLKVRARSHGRSLQKELQIILKEAAVGAIPLSMEEFLSKASAIRVRTAGHVVSDSAELVREDRDR
jgi:plasmid stability protein